MKWSSALVSFRQWRIIRARLDTNPTTLPHPDVVFGHIRELDADAYDARPTTIKVGADEDIDFMNALTPR